MHWAIHQELGIEQTEKHPKNHLITPSFTTYLRAISMPSHVHLRGAGDSIG